VNLGLRTAAALGAALLLPGGSTASLTPPPPPDKPSVLLLLLPAIGTRLGCYGAGPRTPNIDRLARLGRRFERAYAQYPASAASRVSVMLGQRPETTGIWGPPEASWLEQTVPLHERFRAAGYRTIRVGRVYGGAAEGAQAWDVVDKAPSTPGSRAESPARRVAALLEARRDRPFFLATTLGDDPRKEPGPASSPTAVTSPPGLPALAVSRGSVDRPGRLVRPALLSAQARRARLAALDARIARLDADVGIVLSALDRSSLWRNVIVALVSDHGVDLGSHGSLPRPDLLFEDTLRTSLILTLPGLAAPGASTAALAEVVDIYPTLLDLCGLKGPPGIEGTSLVPALRDPRATVKTAAFSTVERRAGNVGRSVRTGRYRYTEWPDGSEELYDHEADPNEWTNLATSAESRPALADMRRLLDARERTAPPPPPHPTPTRAARRRLNVLLMVLDDLTVRLGSYGYDVKTPNIDRLASLGRRFDRAYAQVPTCNPSRTSFMTGWRPERTRVWSNLVSPRPSVRDAVPLQELFHADGYFTARVGKIYHGPWESQFQWDLAESLPLLPRASAASGDDEGHEGDRSENEEGAAATWWVATDNTDEDEPDGQRARRVAQLVAERRGRPFFIGLGFAKPHLRWIAPRKYFDSHPPGDIRVDAEPLHDLDDVPAIAVRRNTPLPAPRLLATGRTPELDEAGRRQAIAAYDACVSFVDAQVGVVLEALDRLRLWDDTIVVLFGDHGFHLGEHGLWRKGTLFEAATRTPLIVAAPQVRRAGAATREVVELLDLYPTLVELAGLARPAGIQGQSLVPFLDDPEAKGRGTALSFRQCAPPRLGRTVRTDRYRFTEWPDGSRELYDAERDPAESTNLAGDSHHGPAEDEMKRLLDAGPSSARPTHPQGADVPSRP